ncbi:MAG: outer membrane protein assembly factor BamA [Candidatus Omnitrophota bacterium]|nr:outer membrane protein assembly factor BamA [Candidatus Omnitrophota bacterium]
MRRKTFLLFLFIILINSAATPLFAQEEKQQTQETLPAPPLAPDVAEDVPALPEKNITAIEVLGNKAISSNTLISKMKMRVGSPYRENVSSDDLKRLYLLGYFSDIKIDTQDYKDGVKVVITVVERPIIEKITFSGIVHITQKDEKLKESLKSKESQYLDYPNLAEDKHILEQMYEKMGYSQAKVDYSIEENKETNKVKIFFNIVEGRKVRIKDIYVQGNKDFTAARILRLIKTKRAWLFNAGVLKEEVIKEDMERLRSFYRRAGYTDASAGYEVKGDAKKPYLLYITITILEGKKYLVGTVIVSGSKDISQKEILDRLKLCVPGNVYSQEAMKQDIASIQALYFDRGYISCVVQEATSVNTNTGHVDIVYNIIENEIAYVGRVRVKGNIKTRDLVIRRELRIHPGDRFDGEKLRRSRERLKNLGFFDEVSYDTEETKEPNKKDLVVDVKETKTGAFSFGGGYSTVDQLVGFVEIEQKNFDWRNWPYFTGGGQNLKFRASFGTVDSGYDLSFTEPWLFDYPVTFGFDGYRRTQSKDTSIGYGYDQNLTGGDARLGKELTEYLRADLTYRFDKINISNIDQNATDDLKKEAGTNIISSIQTALSFDSRDNAFDTHRGNLLTGFVEWAGGPFGGDKNYAKFYGRASHYFPLFLQSTLEARGRVGLVKPYGNSDDVPIYERFFAGGANTVRGYHERKVGPLDPVTRDPLGGQALMVGNLEYLYPLFDFLKLAAFYDVGNVWAKTSKLATGGFKSGFGVGIRMKTPIGPITLDYGIPLNKEEGEEKRGGGQVHFSASQGF